MKGFHSESIDRLYRALLLLETEEECAAFLEDLCTIMELQDMAQRLDAAVMLKQGHNYQMISREIGISTATISRVNRSVSDGNGSYDMIFERLEKKEEDK